MKIIDVFQLIWRIESQNPFMERWDSVASEAAYNLNFVNNR